MQNLFGDRFVLLNYIYLHERKKERKRELELELETTGERKIAREFRSIDIADTSQASIVFEFKQSKQK